MIVWVLILTINFNNQEVEVGRYANEELCNQVATGNVRYFGDYAVFKKYSCRQDTQ
jgi:hypothetical protein